MVGLESVLVPLAAPSPRGSPSVLSAPGLALFGKVTHTVDDKSRIV